MPDITIACRIPEPLVEQLDHLAYCQQVEAGSRRRITRSDVIRGLLATAVSSSRPRVRTRRPRRA